MITLGFSLFFSGLVGWVGGASESICLVRWGDSSHNYITSTTNYTSWNKNSLFRLFLVMIVLCMAAEIGGIIALTVFEKSVLMIKDLPLECYNYNVLQIGDVLHLGWKEVNQESKNIIQRQVWGAWSIIRDDIDDVLFLVELLWLGGSQGVCRDQWAHWRQLLREGHPHPQWHRGQVRWDKSNDREDREL